jgi:hypothetical protein
MFVFLSLALSLSLSHVPALIQLHAWRADTLLSEPHLQSYLVLSPNISITSIRPGTSCNLIDLYSKRKPSGWFHLKFFYHQVACSRLINSRSFF